MSVGSFFFCKCAENSYVSGTCTRVGKSEKFPLICFFFSLLCCKYFQFSGWFHTWDISSHVWVKKVEICNSFEALARTRKGLTSEKMEAWKCGKFCKFYHLKISQHIARLIKRMRKCWNEFICNFFFRLSLLNLIWIHPQNLQDSMQLCAGG